MDGRGTTPGGTASGAETGRSDADTWPWACLDCGETIYHDGEFCRGCASAHRLREYERRTPDREGFVAWMRRESAPTYVLKVTAIAGVELALTTLWLKLLLRGTTELSRVVPVVT